MSTPIVYLHPRKRPEFLQLSLRGGEGNDGSHVRMRSSGVQRGCTPGLASESDPRIPWNRCSSMLLEVLYLALALLCFLKRVEGAQVASFSCGFALLS